MVSFTKSGNVGIRLAGGNAVGIFVAAVQHGSSAAQQGLDPGDQLLKVNEADMAGVTREEAVNMLVALKDRVELLTEHNAVRYREVITAQKGDSFYIR